MADLADYVERTETAHGESTNETSSERIFERTDGNEEVISVEIDG